MRRNYRRRPYTGRFTKRVARVASRVDRRAVQRTEGIWEPFYMRANMTTSTSTEKSLFFQFPGSTDGFAEPTTIYGMDSLLSVYIQDAGSTSPYMLPLAVVGTILKKNVATTDLPTMWDEQTANQWPWRFWHNVHLFDAGDENPLRAVTVPFRFRFKNRIVLPEHAQFTMRVSAAPAPATATIRILWSGRCRIIKKKV